MRQPTLPIRVFIAVACACIALAASAMAAAPLQRAAGADTTAPPIPILVAAMVHIDPFATPDSTTAISKYDDHRAGFLWYLNLADSLGVKISAQATGVYAEACVRQGHWTDFAPLMPGGNHHFGTHIHPKVKGDGAYLWRELDAADRSNPDSVRTVMADNIPWVNEIFSRNGVPSAANDFLHGTSAYYDYMDTTLWCQPTPVPVPYPNCFTMSDGERGQLWVYRGPFGMEPDERADTSYVKMPEVGGIIGFNAVHGPEGYAAGELAFQKRDFLRAYMEWREMARRGEHSAVRHFTWMIHPYQLVPGYVGTDGMLVRDTIVAFIEWLNANWIGQTDETGNVVATYANAEEIRDRYEAWSAAYPVEKDSLDTRLASGDWPLYLPGIYDRLSGTYYASAIPYPDPNVTAHAFADTANGEPVIALWTHADTTTLDSSFTGPFEVTYGDGSTTVLPTSLIVIRTEPILIQAIDVSAARDREGRPSRITLSRPVPNPFNPVVHLRYHLPTPGHVEVRVFAVDGSAVVTLVDRHQSAGTHALRWNGTNARGEPMASGVYFFRLAANGRVVTRKSVLLK